MTLFTKTQADAIVTAINDVITGLTSKAETTNTPPWGDIPKTKENFPDKSDFIVQRGDVWSDWKLPYKTKDGKIHCGSLPHIEAAIHGARSGEKINLNAEERARYERAKSACGYEPESE